jgi:hypothetical protein
MGEQAERPTTKPGHYWDLNEARWVAHSSPDVDALVPAQPDAADRTPDLAVTVEADVPSG